MTIVLILAVLITCPLLRFSHGAEETAWRSAGDLTTEDEKMHSELKRVSHEMLVGVRRTR